MEERNFTSAMSDPHQYRRSMEEHFGAIEEELYGLKCHAQSLIDQNVQLDENVNYLIDSERDLKSAFMAIKTELAETQQILGQTETVARDGVMGGSTGYQSVYHEMLDFIRKVSRENIALNEKLRRQREILTETKQAAAASATRHQKVITDLMTKLNSMQTLRDKFYDEQCVSEWQKLRQGLELWTRRTFKDKSLLSRMTLRTLQKGALTVGLTEDIPQDTHGKHAYIQGVISDAIFQAVFDCTFVFSPNKRAERVLRDIGEIIKNSDNSRTWENWRTATSKALGNGALIQHQRIDDTFNQLVQTVESLFGEYHSQNISKNNSYKALKKIFRDCSFFKHKLEQQEFDYGFHRSPTASVYSPEHMNSLNFKDGIGSTVQISVWPSLWKVSFDNKELLIEREAVWTKEPAHVDIIAME